MTTWTTRAETARDIPTVREINLAAFGTPEEADLVDALRTDPSWIDGLSIVTAAPDGTLVGHALLTRCHIGETPALCLAPCAVLPGHQRSGAGSAAIRSGLQAARDMGERYVTVLGHASYYPRFGFTRASAHAIRLTIDVPDEAMMAMSLDPAHPLPSGTVRYPAPFGVPWEAVEQTCPDCGAPGVDAPESCRELFGQVGLREFTDQDFFASHRLTVDAYCLQHPDVYMRSTKSAAAHLAAMCWSMERGPSRDLPTALKRWLDGPRRFARLTPPAQLSRGDLTVRHVLGVDDPTEYAARAHEWACSAWQAWRDHHDQARQWLSEALGGGRG